MGRRAVVDDTPPLHSNVEAQEAFLDGVRDGLTLTAAANRAGYSRRSFFDLRRDNPAFAERFAEAVTAGGDIRAEIVEEKFDRWVDEEGCSPALRIVWAKRNNPAFREAARLPGGGDQDDSKADQIAEALDRFTQTVVSLASRGPAALPAARAD